jgi:predicted nucleotidyltransferase
MCYDSPEVMGTVKLQIAVPEDKIADFCRRWQITELALFGSVVRDDFHPESDIDVLATFAPNTRWSLFDLVTMEHELEDILGREVDLVQRSAVEQAENYIRRKSILDNAETIYAP